jgi:hypothetical protein
VDWGFEVIRFTAIITTITFSKLITVLRATEVIGVIRIGEGYKDFSEQGLPILGTILTTMLIKNRVSPSESRGQRCTQVPPGPEHMSMQ